MKFKRVENGFRVFNKNYDEIAYAHFGVSGLAATVEFPSDWHENARVWFYFGLGLARFSFSLPYSKTVPDEMQCSGPRYGFKFYAEYFWIYYGKSKGRKDDPVTTINMPWKWRHRKYEILSEKETHPYKYTLEIGEVQHRTATINIEERTWTRWWLPRKQVRRYIQIEFNDEVGERTGTWKGGVIGCSYDQLPGETALQTLQRMEKERIFR